MRGGGGGFGRQRYEKPLPGQQFHSYEDAIYPPRAYRYHTQQALPVPTGPPQRGGSGGGASSAGSSYVSEPQATTPIALPTIDADAACGPFLRSGLLGGTGGPSTSGSSVGLLSRSTASVTPSNGTDGIGDAERRPPPRLQHFFDCFVPDEEATDVQSLAEVWRDMEPLNPFHYRELWGGIDGVVAADAPVPAAWVKAEAAEGEQEAPARKATAADGDGSALKAEDGKSRPATATTASTTRAARSALRRTLRAVGLPGELSAMVLLSARLAPGARLSREQEKLLRLRAQRRPAPPRPIRRGAKVFVPASAVVSVTGDAGAGGGLVDVSALGPRVWRAGLRGQAAAGGATAAVLSAVDEFAFDDDYDDARSVSGRGLRAGVKRGRHGDDRGGDLDEGDLPLSELARWGIGGGGAAGGGGAGSGAAAGGGGAGGAVGQGDEEAEEELDEEDDISGGLFDDDDDENMGSEDGNEDGDSFGGGGGGGDYGGDDGF